MWSAICLNLDQSKILLYGNGLTLQHTILTFNNFEEKAFKNIARRGENAGNQPAFSPFPTMFFTLSITVNHHLSDTHIVARSARAFNLNQCKVFVIWLVGCTLV